MKIRHNNPFRTARHTGLVFAYSLDVKEVDASPQEELKQALEAHGLSVYLGNIVEPRKAHRTNHKAPSDNEVLVQKSQQKFYDYQNSELKEVLNPYGKKKLNKS